jgi:hypothetical protein
MQAGKLLLISLAIVVAIYVAFVLTLFLLGRKQDARSVGRVHSRLRDTLQAPARRPDGAKRQ